MPCLRLGLQRHHSQERAMSAATRSVTDLRELAHEGGVEFSLPI